MLKPLNYQASNRRDALCHTIPPAVAEHEQLLGKWIALKGLFDQDRKRDIPFLPKTIGVVTSPTGSVIRDILHRLADRCPSHVIVWPVLVQGEGASKQIAKVQKNHHAFFRLLFSAPYAAL